MKVLANDKMLNAAWLEHISCLHFVRKGYARGSQLREQYNQLLKWAVELDVKNCLADLREAEMLEMEDLEWFIHQWLPKVLLSVSKGQRWAILLSEDIFQRMELKIIFSRVRLTDELASLSYFTNEQEALQWIGIQSSNISN
jgi:hypothetical protein